MEAPEKNPPGANPLDVIKEPAADALVVVDDRQALQEWKSFANAKVEVEIAALRQDMESRKTYANRIYWLAVGWLSAVGVILLLHIGNFSIFEALPENVLIALVAGSTTGVLGILASVIAYIFRAPGK